MLSFVQLFYLVFETKYFSLVCHGHSKSFLPLLSKTLASFLVILALQSKVNKKVTNDASPWKIILRIRKLFFKKINKLF
jgi:hypothetical protein